MATIEMEVVVRSEIGIAPTEIGKVQSLIVALHVKVADHRSDAAAHSGQISDTLDYSRLRQIVHDVFKDRRYSLLEEVTTTIRGQLLLLDHIESAKVSVTKSHPWADVPWLRLTR